MSLLGFDALGRWALGQLPSYGNYTLIAVPGSAIVIGQAAGFRTFEFAGASSFALTGSAVSFGTAEPAGTGALALTGVAAAFRTVEATAVGTFMSNGAAALGVIRQPGSAGAFSLSGLSIQYATSLSCGRGAFAAAGNGSIYSRDFEAWVPRPFGTMSWQAEALPLVQSWSNAVPAPDEWSAEGAPSSVWTPAIIEHEPWTIE